MKKLCLLGLWLVMLPGIVSAETPNSLMTTMTPEIRVVERHGRDEQIRYVPAHNVAQGQEIYYTVRIVNTGDEKVRHAAVVEPVPPNTHLLEKSVTGAGASLSYSIDGGKNFVAAVELHNGNVEPSAASPRITHIRWQFHHPLAPHVTVLARFRVVFD